MNLVIYTTPDFPQPDREQILSMPVEPWQARRIWAAVDEVQQINGHPIRSARLLIGAEIRSNFDVRSGRPIGRYDSDDILEFRRLSIRFLTVTEPALYQCYTAAKSLVDAAWQEILRSGTLHNVALLEAHLQEGGMLEKNGSVEHVCARETWRSIPQEEKKRWK